MNVKTIRIGNSRGVRIPEEILDRCQVEDAVELKFEKNKIILEPLRRKPREGWGEAAQQMHEVGDDALLMPDVFDDDVEVEWK